MGASDFFVVASGATPKEAFDSAVSEAQYDHGHSGYTGTIAEKSGFVEFPRNYIPDGMKVQNYADAIIGNNLDELPLEYQPKAQKVFDVVDDKWGAAACIQLGINKWCFFGWASS